MNSFILLSILYLVSLDNRSMSSNNNLYRKAQVPQYLDSAFDRAEKILRDEQIKEKQKKIFLEDMKALQNKEVILTNKQNQLQTRLNTVKNEHALLEKVKETNYDPRTLAKLSEALAQMIDIESQVIKIREEKIIIRRQIDELQKKVENIRREKKVTNLSILDTIATVNSEVDDISSDYDSDVIEEKQESSKTDHKSKSHKAPKSKVVFEEDIDPIVNISSNTSSKVSTEKSQNIDTDTPEAPGQSIHTKNDNPANTNQQVIMDNQIGMNKSASKSTSSKINNVQIDNKQQKYNTNQTSNRSNIVSSKDNQILQKSKQRDATYQSSYNNIFGPVIGAIAFILVVIVAIITGGSQDQ